MNAHDFAENPLEREMERRAQEQVEKNDLRQRMDAFSSQEKTQPGVTPELRKELQGQRGSRDLPEHRLEREMGRNAPEQAEKDGLRQRMDALAAQEKGHLSQEWTGPTRVSKEGVSYRYRAAKVKDYPELQPGKTVTFCEDEEGRPIGTAEKHADGTIRVRTCINDGKGSLAGGGRQGYESSLPRGSEVGLGHVHLGKEVAQEYYVRAHAAGQGCGPESPYGIALATEVLPNGPRVERVLMLESPAQDGIGEQAPVLAKCGEQHTVQDLLRGGKNGVAGFAGVDLAQRLKGFLPHVGIADVEILGQLLADLLGGGEQVVQMAAAMLRDDTLCAQEEDQLLEQRFVVGQFLGIEPLVGMLVASLAVEAGLANRRDDDPVAREVDGVAIALIHGRHATTGKGAVERVERSLALQGDDEPLVAVAEVAQHGVGELAVHLDVLFAGYGVPFGIVGGTGVIQHAAEHVVEEVAQDFLFLEPVGLAGRQHVGPLAKDGPVMFPRAVATGMPSGAGARHQGGTAVWLRRARHPPTGKWLRRQGTPGPVDWSEVHSNRLRGDCQRPSRSALDIWRELRADHVQSVLNLCETGSPPASLVPSGRGSSHMVRLA